MLRDLLAGSGSMDILCLTLSEDKIQFDDLLRLEPLVIRNPQIAIDIVRALVHLNGPHFIKDLKTIMVKEKIISP